MAGNWARSIIMIFGVILVVITIVLTFYIFFSAAKFQNHWLLEKSYEMYQKQEKFTKMLSFLALLSTITWWSSYVLVKFIEKDYMIFDQRWLLDSTINVILAIVIILIMLTYRNRTYKKFFMDNVIKIFLYEYVMIFIFGIMYASIITYVFEISNVLF
jgi:multisubunit Na+/H+ antiporter MnhB subunit